MTTKTPPVDLTDAKILKGKCAEHEASTYVMPDMRVICSTGHTIGHLDMVKCKSCGKLNDQFHTASYPQCALCGIHWKQDSCDDCSKCTKGEFRLCITGCKGAKTKTFHTADYFSCDDSVVELSHECWTEAIAEHVDGWYDPQTPNRPIDEIIADMAPLTVYGWTRKKIEDTFGESCIDNMLESLDEDWHEDYGNPDGGCVFEGEEKIEVTDKFYALMRECMKDVKPWSCDNDSEMVFEEEELTAILKEHSPHWWEGDDG